MHLSVVLWCNVWMINVRWGKVKVKSGADISLLLQKNTKMGIGFNIRQTNRYQHYIYIYIYIYIFAAYALRRDLRFNPGVFWSKNLRLRICSTIPPSSNLRNVKIFTLTWTQPETAECEPGTLPVYLRTQIQSLSSKRQN